MSLCEVGERLWNLYAIMPVVITLCHVWFLMPQFMLFIGSELLAWCNSWYSFVLFRYITYSCAIYWKPLILLSNKIEKHYESIWKYSSKIKVPHFSYCHYVCMCVCMYALSLQPTPFELTSWNLKQEVIIW